MFYVLSDIEKKVYVYKENIYEGPLGKESFSWVRGGLNG